jgi:hypothetical protein
MNEQMPKLAAHSLALRTLAEMLRDVLGSRYEDHLDSIRGVLQAKSVEADPDDFWPQVRGEFETIFDEVEE